MTSKVPGSAPGIAYGFWSTVNTTPWMPVGCSVYRTCAASSVRWPSFRPSTVSLSATWATSSLMVTASTLSAVPSGMALVTAGANQSDGPLSRARISTEAVLAGLRRLGR